MKMKRIFQISMVLAILVVLSFSLTSCLKPASEGPEGEVPDEQMPVPGETLNPIDAAATATKQAQQPVAQPTKAPAESTSAPVAVTETPVPTQGQPAPTNTTVPVVQPTAGIPKEYTLQYGEFPFCIARRFNVNQYDLLNKNGLTLTSPVYVGMVLKIPQNGNTFEGERALKAHPANYTVQAGDTLNIIACKFGDVSPDMIALQNNLSGAYTLSVGQVLLIP
jgi:LysM repeat protein